MLTLQVQKQVASWMTQSFPQSSTPYQYQAQLLRICPVLHWSEPWDKLLNYIELWDLSRTYFVGSYYLHLLLDSQKMENPKHSDEALANAVFNVGKGKTIGPSNSCREKRRKCRRETVKDRARWSVKYFICWMQVDNRYIYLLKVYENIGYLKAELWEGVYIKVI